MNLLLENPLAHMYGPHFLWLYAMCAIVVIVIGYRLAHSGDHTPAGAVAGRDRDPYELACLRGGEEEVHRLAILSLVQKGYLELVNWVAARGRYTGLQEREQHPDPAQLSGLERVTYDALAESGTGLPASCSNLGDALRPYTVAFKEKLQRESLVPATEAEARARKARWSGLVVLLGLAGYKIAAALMTGHQNVMLLILAAIAATIIHCALCKPGAQTDLGEALLGDFRERYKSSSRLNHLETALSPSVLLLVTAIYGLSILQGTGYEDVGKSLEQPSWGSMTSADSGGGCGGGCGGGGCGGGCGGCGGCG